MRTSGTFTFKGKRVYVTATDPIEESNWNGEDWAHYAYKVTIKWDGRQFTFPYLRGIGNNPNDIPAIEPLVSVASDARAYRDNPNFWDFVSEFGYEQDEEETNFNSPYWGYSKARKAYDSCRKISIALERVFRGNVEEFISDSRIFDY